MSLNPEMISSGTISNRANEIMQKNDEVVKLLKNETEKIQQNHRGKNINILIY